MFIFSEVKNEMINKNFGLKKHETQIWYNSLYFQVISLP